MDHDAVRTDIWAQECAIYRGRGAGSLTAYLDMLAPGFLAWPPHRPAPIARAGLATQPLGTQERLEMTLIDFTLHGPTALIYYQTHRTARPDGTQVDERFDVIHVWIEDNGAWKILGGMARAMPAR